MLWFILFLSLDLEVIWCTLHLEAPLQAHVAGENLAREAYYGENVLLGILNGLKAIPLLTFLLRFALLTSLLLIVHLYFLVIII